MIFSVFVFGLYNLHTWHPRNKVGYIAENNMKNIKKLTDWIKENKASDYYVDCGNINSFEMASETGGSLLMWGPKNTQEGCVIRRIK